MRREGAELPEGFQGHSLVVPVGKGESVMDSTLETLRPVLRDLVAGLARKYIYASAFLSRRTELRVMSSSRDERVVEGGPVAGAVFTIWNGSHFEEIATGDLTPGGLAEAARKIAGSPLIGVRGEGDGSAAERLVTGAFRGTFDYSTPLKIDPATVSLERKLDLCRSTRDRAAKLDPRVVDTQSNYTEENCRSLFVGPTSDMSQEVWRVSFGFFDVAAEGDVVRYDGATTGGTGGFELAVLKEDEWDAVAGRIPQLLKATPIKPGYYDVVLGQETAGLIAHEAFGHGVETDMFLKDRAKSREYLGKPVGSELVDLYDDPTYPGGPATYGFDDEGQTASRTQILRKGIFIQGLTDLYSSFRLGIPRTANGRRQDVNKVYPRMTNTYFGGGAGKFDDMIASIDHGFYLGGWGSGMEDPKDWGIQCVIGWAREIESGKLTNRYHTNVGLTGYVPDLLQSVTMVGSDLKLSGEGYCGKGHKEFIRVGLGGPHLKMKARLG